MMLGEKDTGRHDLDFRRPYQRAGNSKACHAAPAPSESFSRVGYRRDTATRLNNDVPRGGGPPWRHSRILRTYLEVAARVHRVPRVQA